MGKIDNMDCYQSNAQLTRLIAHEVRNPLTNINLAIDQLKTESAINTETFSLLDLIERNSNRINLLINNLLASFKTFELRLNAADMHQLIEDALAILKENIEYFELQVDLVFFQPSFVIEIDKGKIKVALINIISNALNAMVGMKKGKLTITTAADNKECRLLFEDNGSGIDKKSVKKIFEPFFTSNSKGAGLGLTSTKNIIEAHGGSINIDSNKKDGTKVEVRLPIMH